MKKFQSASFVVVLSAIALCGAFAAPAHAWSWPWERDSATTSPETINDSLNPVPSDVAPARRSDSEGAVLVKVLGTIENVDAANRRFIVKTRSGKYESFRLSKSSVIFKHHRKLTPSALKSGEHVRVRCRPGSNAAVRVYVLEEQQA